MKESDQWIEIRWTSGSIDEARRISRYLVQERFVASAQIIPWVESITLLDNKLETTQESLVVLKAPAQHFEKIREPRSNNIANTKCPKSPSTRSTASIKPT